MSGSTGWCGRPRTGAVTTSASSPTSRARRSGSGASRTARSSSSRGRSSPSRRASWRVVRASARRRTTGCPATWASATRSSSTTARCGSKCSRWTGPRCSREVKVGGPVSNNKGINLPGVAVSVPALSEKDIEDLRWALHLAVDFIALSFVRSAADVEDVRADHARGGRLPSGDRQDREAAGDRQHRRDRRRVRRLHGRPRRPGRGVPARGRAVPAEAGHREGPTATPSRSSWRPRCSSR